MKIASMICAAVLMSAGTAGAFGGLETLGALQNHQATAQDEMTVQDCESYYRSFRARNTLTPRERRTGRNECIDLAKARERTRMIAEKR